MLWRLFGPDDVTCQTAFSVYCGWISLTRSPSPVVSVSYNSEQNPDIRLVDPCGSNFGFQEGRAGMLYAGLLMAGYQGIPEVIHT